MKTKILNSKLLLLAFSALFIVSCSVEDGIDGAVGPQGPQGIQGPKGDQGEPGQDGNDGTDGQNGQDGTNGQDGEDGQDGTNGQDGNTNVNTYNFNILTYSGEKFEIPFEELTDNVLRDDAILAYLYADGVNGLWYPIPGIAYTLSVEVELREGFINIYFYSRQTGAIVEINQGYFDELKIVIISSSSTTTGKSDSNTILAKMKSDGIDPNNYYEVLDYFNLEY